MRLSHRWYTTSGLLYRPDSRLCARADQRESPLEAVALGNVGANSIRGPATWQFDTALSRTFQIRETKKVEFRAEAFNVANSVRFNITPNGAVSSTNGLVTNFNSGNFGQITAAYDPRILQFALKYFF